MKINELLKAMAALSNDGNTETFDLTTEEGYEGFKKAIADLRKTDPSIFNLFGIDINEWLDNVEELGKNLREAKKDIKEIKNKRKDLIKEGLKQMERKEVDHSEEDDDEDKKEDINEQEFKRPSELLSIEQKLQLHKLVQEYVDTTIRPFNKGILSNDQINDAYAGLYEFGAWILNK